MAKRTIDEGEKNYTIFTPEMYAIFKTDLRYHEDDFYELMVSYRCMIRNADGTYGVLKYEGEALNQFQEWFNASPYFNLHNCLFDFTYPINFFQKLR